MPGLNRLKKENKNSLQLTRGDKIGRISKIGLLFVLITLFSCYEGAHIDFRSYQELAKYNFLDNGWFPEILKADAKEILEVYDVNNKHLYGKFDFSQREKYDSIVNSYTVANADSLLERVKNINTPHYPEWFVPKKELANDKYMIFYHSDFYLITEKRTNRIYFLR
jgi:hypothetical protein